MEKIGIIGSGTWGTAIAVLLKNNGHEVTLWSAIPAEIEVSSGSSALVEFARQLAAAAPVTE